MGRGPSQIGRAPAHLTVLPGGAAGLEDLEDDKTTIEPEPPSSDDAPTPIAASNSMDEQWEDGTTVAESGEKRTVVDEPTVEDQARPLPPLQLVQNSPSTVTGAQDPRALAKLFVLSGSDQGRTFELRPGKDLTVGRAVDNDVCLTDIAVSRRHLELGWDGDAWILRDRGSGNGTLINDRIEDGKCQMRDGDRIEIGNTIFRFDHPPSAAQPTVTGWGQEEEEAATVAGKPGRSPSSTPVPVFEQPRPRHNSVTAAAERRSPPPPGTPPRAKRPSAAPPGPDARERPMTVRGMPAMTPPPRMEAPAPASAPGAAPPQFLAGGSGTGPAAAGVPTSMGTPPIQSMFGPGVRPATTTALVEPRMYPPSNPYPFVLTPDSRRKHLMIGAGVAGLLLIIGLGAMIGGDDAPPPKGASAKVVGAETGSDKAKLTTPSAAQIPEVGSATALAAIPGAGAATGSAAEPAVGAGSAEPAVGSGSAEPAVGSGSAEPAVGSATPPPPTPPDPPAPPPVVDEPEMDPPTPAVQRHPPAPPVQRQPVVRTPPRRTPPPRVAVRSNDDLLEKPVVVKPGVKGVAATEKKADGLYRSKEWKAASALLREAAAGASDADAKRLKSVATDYDTIGVNLSTGATLAKANPTQALGALEKALKADRRVGGAHQQAIRDNMAKIAPSAAAAYMAKQNYPMAKLAADEAVNVGAGSNATVANVRSSLERKAGELFASAQKLQSSQPEEAKNYLRTIMKIVPTDSPWYGKAYKLLNQRKSAAVDEDE